MSNGNFTVRCISNKYNPRLYTPGKVYKFKNGYTTIDDGRRFPMQPIKDFKDWCCFTSSDFELVNDNQAIVIYRKDAETIALLKEGKKVIKSANAKCNPSDTYDFEIGATLAFSRLMGDELAVKEVKRVAKLGEYVKVVDHTDEFPLGLIARCVWVCDDNIHKFEANGEEYYMLPKRYVVLEGYVPEEKPTVKEVKRPAKVGEWIKLTKQSYTFNKIGDILPVCKSDDAYVCVYDKDQPKGRKEPINDPFYEWAYSSDGYVVLENYQPKEATTNDLSKFTNEELIAELAKRLK